MNSALKPVLTATTASGPQTSPAGAPLNKPMHTPQSGGAPLPTTYGQPQSNHMNLPHTNNPTVAHNHPNPAHQSNHYSLNVPSNASMQHYMTNNPSSPASHHAAIPVSKHPVANVTSSQVSTGGQQQQQQQQQQIYTSPKNVVQAYTTGYQSNLGHPPNQNPIPPVSQTLPATTQSQISQQCNTSAARAADETTPPPPPPSDKQPPHQSNGTPDNIKTPPKPENLQQENHHDLPSSTPTAKDKPPIIPQPIQVSDKIDEQLDDTAAGTSATTVSVDEIFNKSSKSDAAGKVNDDDEDDDDDDEEEDDDDDDEDDEEEAAVVVVAATTTTTTTTSLSTTPTTTNSDSVTSAVTSSTSSTVDSLSTTNTVQCSTVIGTKPTSETRHLDSSGGVLLKENNKNDSQLIESANNIVVAEEALGSPNNSITQNSKTKEPQQQQQLPVQKPISTMKLATTPRTPVRKSKIAAARIDSESPKSSSSKSGVTQKSPGGGSTGKSKRTRIRTQPYQSPLPEIEIITKISSSTPKTKNADDKLIVFYKNEFLAVRNSEGSFYICQAVQNIYKSSPKIRIRWLSQDKNEKSGETFTPDFYDTTDFDCILTNLNLERVDKGKYRLPPAEKERTDSILKRSLAVEKGEVTSPSLTEEHPDGLDVSLYKAESQLTKRKSSKRKASASPSKAGSAKSDDNTAKSPDQSKVRRVNAKKTKKSSKNKNLTKHVAKKQSPQIVGDTTQTTTIDTKKPTSSSRTDRAKRRSDNQTHHSKVSPVVDAKKAKVLAKMARKTTATSSSSSNTARIATSSKSQPVVVVNKNVKVSKAMPSSSTTTTTTTSSRVHKQPPKPATRKTTKRSRK